RRVEVTTHVYDDCEPSRSLTIFGSELETIELARIATNMPRRIPEGDSMTSRRVIGAGAPAVPGGAVRSAGVLVIRRWVPCSRGGGGAHVSGAVSGGRRPVRGAVGGRGTCPTAQGRRAPWSPGA